MQSSCQEQINHISLRSDVWVIKIAERLIIFRNLRKYLRQTMTKLLNKSVMDSALIGGLLSTLLHHSITTFGFSPYFSFIVMGSIALGFGCNQIFSLQNTDGSRLLGILFIFLALFISNPIFYLAVIAIGSFFLQLKIPKKNKWKAGTLWKYN